MYSSQRNKARPLPKYFSCCFNCIAAAAFLRQGSALISPSRKQAEAPLACTWVLEAAGVRLPAPSLLEFPLVHPQLLHRSSPCIWANHEMHKRIVCILHNALFHKHVELVYFFLYNQPPVAFMLVSGHANQQLHNIQVNKPEKLTVFSNSLYLEFSYPCDPFAAGSILRPLPCPQFLYPVFASAD
jgi:hypothetical protein